jgi:hypothetical protein
MADDSSNAPSRFKLAFTSAWNLAGLGVCGVLAAVTKSPVPIIAAGALEAAWLAFATRPRASSRLFPGAHRQASEAAKRSRRAQLVALLSEDEVERVQRLEDRRREILRLADDNKAIAREVLLAEIARLDDVVDAFVDLAADTRRWESYNDAIDLTDLDSETRRYEDEAQRALDEEQRQLARKNLDVLLRRREQIDEMRRKISKTRAQLDLIESTFRLIGNEIMLMRDTGQLRGQLDDLVVGVQAVREMSEASAVADDAAELDPSPRRAAQAAAATSTTTRRP